MILIFFILEKLLKIRLLTISGNVLFNYLENFSIALENFSFSGDIIFSSVLIFFSNI
jgi:hypothetical protein